MYFFQFQNLHADCKTRWSSLCTCIESVIRIAEPFDKITDHEFTKEEFILLKEIYDALEPVRVLTIEICSDSANLLTADVAFQVAFDWLKNQKTPLAKKLREELRKR